MAWQKGNCKSWSTYLWREGPFYFTFSEIQISPKEEMEVNPLLLMIKVKLRLELHSIDKRKKWIWNLSCMGSKLTLRSVHTRRQVAATCRGDTLQRQIASCVLENFCENLCRCNRICRRNKSHRFSLIWFFATCCSDKIMLRRQRFSQKFSSTHEAICRCDVSPHLVSATSRPTCTHRVIYRRDVLQQLVA